MEYFPDSVHTTVDLMTGPFNPFSKCLPHRVDDVHVEIACSWMLNTFGGNDVLIGGLSLGPLPIFLLRLSTTLRTKTNHYCCQEKHELVSTSFGEQCRR